jgi:ribosomal-protein-serine acetyltransferase
VPCTAPFEQRCGTIAAGTQGERNVGAVPLVVDEWLELRPITEAIELSLVEAVRESHGHLAPWMVWATEDYGPQDAQVFLSEVASGNERAYAIGGREEGAFHGVCSLNRVDEANRTANLGYWLRPTSTHRGFATRSVRRLLVHALEDLELERVEIAVSTENTASVRVAQRLELREEGLRGRAIRVGDEQHDARVFAAFLSDLEQLRSASPHVA